MTLFSVEVAQLVVDLDAAVQAHLGWSRRVLRCAVLREPPGDDVLAPDAHQLCDFGRCCDRHRARFAELPGFDAGRMLAQHRLMHDAVRALCVDILAHGRGQRAQLDTFERTQSELVSMVAHLKTEVLSHSARHDDLTGLPLRHDLKAEFERCRSTAQRHGEHLIVVLIDVDHFKHVNDTHGHSVGDRALRHVAGILREHARVGEPVFRYGGEEFLLLLQTDGIAAAERAIERLLRALRECPMPMPEQAPLNLRVSAGLAIVSEGEGLAQAIELADRALYDAKSDGRDRWRWSRA